MARFLHSHQSGTLLAWLATYGIAVVALTNRQGLPAIVHDMDKLETIQDRNARLMLEAARRNAPAMRKAYWQAKLANSDATQVRRA